MLGFLRFLIRRIIGGILVLFVVDSATFFLFFSRPVEIVARQLAGRAATPAVIAEVIRNLGLNDPIRTQYLRFLNNLIHFNLGTSFYSQQSVNTLVAQDLPITASVVFGAVILWLVVGLGVGILSATRARSLFDRVATVGVLAGLSMPVFVLGELLILVVFLGLSKHGITWIQPGYVGLSEGLGPWIGHMIMPWITLATVQAAIYTRLSRGSLLDTMGEDYIRTARAKGLGERRVIYKHGVRAALTPVVSQLGVDVGALLGGVVVVEQVFGLNGLGSATIGAIDNGDLPVIIAFVLLAAAFVVIANIIVDAAYALLDPRVRIS